MQQRQIIRRNGERRFEARGEERRKCTRREEDRLGKQRHAQGAEEDKAVLFIKALLEKEKERKKKENFLFFYKNKMQKQNNSLEKQFNNISRRANEFALDHDLDLTKPAAERLMRWQTEIKNVKNKNRNNKF
jgi:hypothetical protein